MKLFLTRLAFQDQLSLSIKSATVYSVAEPICYVGRSDNLPGSHLSSQILTEEPSPILLNSPASNAPLPSTIDRQVAEALRGTVACIKSVVGKYLPFSTLEHRPCGFVISRHPCFPNNATLKHSKSGNPIPPLIFGSDKDFQSIHCMEFRSIKLLH